MVVRTLGKLLEYNQATARTFAEVIEELGWVEYGVAVGNAGDPCKVNDVVIVDMNHKYAILGIT